MISWYIHKCNYNYDHKRYGLPAQILIKLTNVQQHSLQISYTKFHPTQTINVETTDNSFMPLRKIWCSIRHFSWNSQSVNKLYWTISKSDANVKSGGNISCMTLSKVWLPLYWLSRPNYSVALSGDLLHKFSPKSVAKYGQYGQKFIYTTV
jgi:hypothetical protein